MTVAYDGSAADITTSTSDTSIVVTAPAGTGGRLYAFGTCYAGRTISPPSGWTEVSNDADATNRTYVWMRADDAASDYTFTASNTFNYAVASVFRLSGASTNTPTTAFASGPNDTAQTAPTITTPSNNCLIFWGIYRAGANTCTASKGTERVDVSNGTSGCFQAVYTDLIVTAGSTTGTVFTTSGFGVKRMFSVAVESSGGVAFMALNGKPILQAVNRTGTY